MPGAAAYPPAAPPVAACGPDPVDLSDALERFLAWLQQAGYSSYDQYDFWATRYGQWSKRLYYRYGASAAPLVLPLIAADWLVPARRRWFCAPSRFPIADAHYLMGFLALFRCTSEPRYLTAAVELARALLASSIAGFSGPCWGYPFDWQTRRGLWLRNTPLVTSTPYAFAAFVQLHAATGVAAYREMAMAIAAFIANDIRDTAVGDGRAAAYTPFDTSQVINASAYRAACLAEAGALADREPYHRIAAANARFVLDQQRADGSWPYSANDPDDQFVDHFHTCFVLAGLFRTYRVLGDGAILRAVERGYTFYRERLFYPDGAPRPFAAPGRQRLRRLELYDHAEALALALLLQSALPTAELAATLAARLLRLQDRAGFFVTRIAAGGIRNRVPYHRWAQAQAFCALAAYREHLTANAS